MKSVRDIRRSMVGSMMAIDAIQKAISAITTAQHAAVRAGVRFDYDAAVAPLIQQQRAARAIYRQACADLELHGDDTYDKTYALVLNALQSAGVEL